MVKRRERMTVVLTDQNFEKEVLQAKVPVLVDFWASWCAPCRMIVPVIEELGEEFEGKIRVGKLNVDENPTTSQKYGVMSIPTLIFFKDRRIVEQLVGVQSKETLTQKIEQILAAGGSS